MRARVSHCSRARLPFCENSLNAKTSSSALLLGNQGAALRASSSRIDLRGIFTTIQTADEAPSKPHPAMLFQAMKETGASPEATIMIGDTSYDIQMAVSANVASIGVTWGYHTMAELRRAGAKRIVHSFAELASTLDGGAVFAQPYEAVA